MEVDEKEILGLKEGIETERAMRVGRGNALEK
jgi:hypothetical protein